MHFAVNAGRPVGPLAINWRSTGFTPAAWLLDPCMMQALSYVGSMPHGAVRYVRIHYLLELVGGSGFDAERPKYDWSRLDAGLDVLLRNGLAPFFELMGNPSGFFNNYLEERQARAWKRLVRDLALRCMERYGREEVESWYFETWNEPDAGWWKQGEEAFMRYYDACSEGLKEANPALRLGGPGTCRHMSALLKAFLAHCDSGTNCFTGQKGVRLDFISVHEKGAGSSKEDIDPDTLGICAREEALAQYIRVHHPRLAHVPIMNNECDPIVGWADAHSWHARPYYAAQVCRSLDLHLRRLVDGLGVRYELLGNDHGFLGRWGNRTLVARFASEEELARGEFEQVKKPVFNAMVLLGFLGPQRLPVKADRRDEPALECGALATLGPAADGGGDSDQPGQVAVLVYHHRDKIMSSGSEHVGLRLEGLPFSDGVLTHYRIDEAHGDPFLAWRAAGARERPPADQMVKIRAAQELALLEEPRAMQARDGALEVEFDLPLPGVSLLLWSRTPQAPPASVTGLRAELYPGLYPTRAVPLTAGRNDPTPTVLVPGAHLFQLPGKCAQTLLIWRPLPARAIRTYQVLHAARPEGPFQRINDQDLICGAYLHVRAPEDAGKPAFYKVRAVDYWGRAGEESAVLGVVA